MTRSGTARPSPPPASPRGNRAFAEADPAGQANVAIAYGGSTPSRLELPVVPGVTTWTDTSTPPDSGSNSGPAGGTLGKCAKKKHAAKKQKRGSGKKQRRHKK